MRRLLALLEALRDERARVVDRLAGGGLLGGRLLSGRGKLLLPGARLEDPLLATGGDLAQLARGPRTARARAA